MQGPSFLDLVGFGPEGWGAALLMATGMTLAVATGGFAAGSVIGAGVAGAKLSRSRALRAFGDGYTTVLRGIPDLLVIYLLLFRRLVGPDSAWCGSSWARTGSSACNGLRRPASIAVGVVSGRLPGRGLSRRLRRGQRAASSRPPGAVGMRPVPAAPPHPRTPQVLRYRHSRPRQHLAAGAQGIGADLRHRPRPSSCARPRSPPAPPAGRSTSTSPPPCSIS
jgi:octopine/nopaline transport system permease protein